MSFKSISASGLRKILESSDSPYIINSRDEVFPRKPDRDYIFKRGKPVPLATLKGESLDANMDYIGDTSFIEYNCKLASYLNTQFQRLEIGYVIRAGPKTAEQEKRLAVVRSDMQRAIDKNVSERDKGRRRVPYHPPKLYR